MFWKKNNNQVTQPDETTPRKKGTYLTRPKMLKVTKKQKTSIALPKNLQKLTEKEIRFIMAKIKSGDFKRYERNQKGHSLLHIFSGLGVGKLAQAFLDMIQSDPNVLNALDNAGNSALDYATIKEIEKLISQHGGRKSIEILEQYSREAVALEKSMGKNTQSNNSNTKE